MRWTSILALLTLSLAPALALAPTASAYCYVYQTHEVGPYGVGPTATPPVTVDPVDVGPVHFGGTSVDPVPVERQEAGVEVRLWGGTCIGYGYTITAPVVCDDAHACEQDTITM